MRALVMAGAVMLQAIAGADDIAVLETQYGRDPLTAVIGNGGLTVGLDGKGRVSVLRWPSPGFYDQLSYESDQLATGIAWGLVRDHRIHWCPAWPWINGARDAGGYRYEQHFALAEFDVSGTAQFRVDPQRPRLEIDVTCDGLQPDDRIVWWANLTPTTRKLPELPVADFALEPYNDFACFADPAVQRLIHFRPGQPGSGDWARLEQVFESGEVHPAAKRFGDGVWIGYTVSGGAEFHCFDARSIGADPLAVPAGGPVAYGFDAASLAVAAFAGGRSTFALDVAESSEALYESFDAPNSHADTVDLAPAVATLLVHQDQITGSTVRSASVRPPLNRDWPRYGAWAIRALDLAGHHDRSSQLISFYLDRISNGGALPAGALPFAMYPDGTSAALQSLVDTEAAAWVLWATVEHARDLQPADRAAFLDEHWGQMAALTGFIADWAEDTTGTPWHAYDPVLGRDRRDRSQIFTGHLALSTVVSLAEDEQLAVPESWTRRKHQWDVLLDSYSRAPGFQFTGHEPLPFWARELFPADHPAVHQAIHARLASLEEQSPPKAARNLAEIALYNAPDASALRQLHPRLARLGLDPAGPPSVAVLTDSYAAATGYVAWALVDASAGAPDAENLR